MLRIFTLQGDDQLKLAQQVHALCGVDATGEPRLVLLNADGSLPVTPGGMQIPVHDSVVASTIVAGVQTILLKLAGTTVGTLTITQGSGGAFSVVLT